MFEMNLVMFRPYLDVFIHISRLPVQYKNESWHKTDCRNVVSDFLMASLQPHFAVISAGERRRGRPVDKIMIF